MMKKIPILGVRNPVLIFRGSCLQLPSPFQSDDYYCFKDNQKALENISGTF